MNTQALLRRLVTAVIVLNMIWWAGGCSKMAGNAVKDPHIDYYTCTMHPFVRSHDPKGKCPVCSMDLVPVLKNGASVESDHAQEHRPAMSEFSVPVERQQQIGVQYASAMRKPLRLAIRSVGFVSADKSKHWDYVARVDGYVQKLYVTSAGESVEKDQPLLTFYSPELQAASREFVNLLEKRDQAGGTALRESTQRLIDAAKVRLTVWNVTESQLSELEKSRRPSDLLTLRSPFKGIVQDVPVEQGNRVKAGDHLVDLFDPSLVWAWADFYENEVPLLHEGQNVILSSDSCPGEPFEGKIAVIDPYLNTQTRTARARIDIPNVGRKLWPGMYLNIELAIERGEGLTIPTSAVLPTGLRNLVFTDEGEGKLKPRWVVLGRKYGSDFEVLGGLDEGDRVVASANFLIDAEARIQGALKAFQEPAEAAVVIP